MYKSKFCYHCNSPIPANVNYVWKRSLPGLGEKEYNYCCNGCMNVSRIILESGNERFYDIRGSQSLTPVRSLDEDKKIRKEYLDSELVKEEYIREVNPDLYEVHIAITNIHCSACVWLNEKVLNEAPGIEYARINYATGRAEIHYAPNRIHLSEIFEMIESIGYYPKLYAPWKNPELTEKNKDLLVRMGVAGFFFGNIMLFGTALYAGYFTGIEMEYKRLLHYLSWAMATPVYLYSGFPFLQGAWMGLKQKKLSMDFLLVTGISLAYFYSVYVTLTDRGEVYFDSVCMIYFFILLGKYLEDNARIRAADKLTGLLTSLPEIATVLTETGEEKALRTSEIKKNMTLLIRSGERIPVDGILVSGSGFVDESFLTGEPKPIHKKENEEILAGSINTGDPILIRVNSDAKNSTLSRLKVLIEKAMGEKPRLERITERISGYFISVVFFLAGSTFLFWFFVSDKGFENAMINTISVLIVACPCALGLAVPTALVMNHIRNSRQGVIIKNPDSVETLAKVSEVFLDKTGTLTEGKPVLSKFQVKNLAIAISYTRELEIYSNHPIAKSLVREMDKLALRNEIPSLLEKDVLKKETIREIPGMGMEALNRDRVTIKLGNARFLNVKDPEGYEDKTCIHLKIGEEYQGYWILEDKLRDHTQEAVQNLYEMVPKITILSGDTFQVVKSIAEAAGIKNFIAEASPEEKLEHIRRSQIEGNTTSMVGDGINDSAALAKADIGISMGIAADLSLDKSDIILVQNDLRSFSQTIFYAKETQRRILQNIGISFLYNSAMLPLAAMGYMAPVICAAFMALSSLSVVGNSLRLRARESKPSMPL